MRRHVRVDPGEVELARDEEDDGSTFERCTFAHQRLSMITAKRLPTSKSIRIFSLLWLDSKFMPATEQGPANAKRRLEDLVCDHSDPSAHCAATFYRSTGSAVPTRIGFSTWVHRRSLRSPGRLARLQKELGHRPAAALWTTWKTAPL